MIQKKSPRAGEFRCLSCFERLSPPAGVEVFTCPFCSAEWRISWVFPDLPKIRGPVWDKMKNRVFKR